MIVCVLVIVLKTWGGTKCTAVYIRSKNVGLYETLLKQRLVSGKNNAPTSLKWLNNEAIPIDEFT